MVNSRSIPGDLGTVALTMMEGLATPRSLTVAILIRYREWDQLAGLSVDPLHYSSIGADKYFRDVQATGFLRKMSDLPTTVDRRKAALQNFEKSEEQCYRTNERLSPYLHESSTFLSDTVVGRVILSARKMIAHALGPYSDTRVSNLARFGPGATYGDKGQLSTVPDKMSSTPTLTRDALPWLFPWTGTAWATACAGDDKDKPNLSPESEVFPSRRRVPLTIPGNRFTTVPKDCLKDRGIAVEPSVNVFYQLGLGSLIRERLKDRIGLDIQSAQDTHGRVARVASIRGHLATIDLSNASDTVCRNLVKLLLPYKWHDALESLRSPKTLVDGKWRVLEKFSSMGNGYTFELETLLFWALASAALLEEGVVPLTWGNVFVYGDDIIVPAAQARGVIAVLRFFGFTPNEAKSFVEGPFRESCGSDFFNGENVRPYHLKESPGNPAAWIALANGIRSIMDRHPHIDLRRAWFRVLDNVPSHVRRCRGPKALGDIVIHDDESRWRVRFESPRDGVVDGIRYIHTYSPSDWRRVEWKHFHPDVILASALLSVGDGDSGVLPRDSVSGYSCAWVPYS